MGFKKILCGVLIASGIVAGLLIWVMLHQPLVDVDITISPQGTVDQADASLSGTIAAALQQLSQNHGGTILLTAGDYYVQRALVLSDNISITGVGTVRIMADEKLHDHVISNRRLVAKKNPALHNITLKNLTIIGNRSIRLNCIQLEASDANRSEDIHLANITVQECGRHGIHIKGANTISLENIHAQNNGQNVGHDHNIYLLRVTGATLNQIYSTGAAGNGFSSTQLHQASINHLVSEANGRRGLRIGGGQDITVQNCQILNNGVNQAHIADGVVITSDDFKHASANITLTDCIITNNQRYGLYVRGTKNVTISHSLIREQPAGDIVSYKSQLTTDQLNDDCIVKEL